MGSAIQGVSGALKGHLKQKAGMQVHLMEWVRMVMATTLGVLPSGALPPIIMQQEVASIWDQIRERPGHSIMTVPRCLSYTPV